MKTTKIAYEILKQGSYITDTRKKIMKLKDLLTTVSDLLEDSDEADIRTLGEHLNHGTKYISDMIKKVK
jgi:hypothetical protein